MTDIAADETQEMDGHAPEAPEEAPKEVSEEKTESSVEDIQPQTLPRLWKFAGEATDPQTGNKGMFEREYVQKPLSYMAMLEFTGLLGATIDRIMNEGFLLSGFRPITRDDFSSTDRFLLAFSKFAQYAPDLFSDSMCIWLRIPLLERPLIKEVWGLPADEGGMSMEEGEQMLGIFIDQNWSEVEDFFVERLGRLRKKVSARSKMLKTEGAAQSIVSPLLKPLKPTPPITQNP